MSDVVIAVVSLILGVAGSVWASKYYFQRSVDKALTPYLQFATSLFTGAKRRMREDLKIAYRGTPVRDLTEVQFLIANTGERSIKEPVRPLTLHVPSGCQVLEASTLHIHPAGREVHVTATESNVVYTFPLLNSGEFFITKLLLSGEAESKDFQFTISAEDLPPVLEPQLFRPDLIEADAPRSFQWAALAFGILLILVGAGVARLVYEIVPLWRDAIENDFLSVLRQNRWIMISSLLAIVPTLMLLIVGTILLFEELFSSIRFRRRRRFRIPAGPGRTFQSGIPIVRISPNASHAIRGTVNAAE